MKKFTVGIILASFLTCIFISPYLLNAQETNAATQVLSAPEIFEKNKHAMVLIEVTITLDDGEKAGGLGSGFFVTHDGCLVTAAHMIVSQKKIDDIKLYLETRGKSVKSYRIEYWVVALTKNKRYAAEVVFYDPDVDMACLKIKNPSNDQFDTVTIGDSRKLAIGESVYALGNPFGLHNTFTHGIVSQLKRQLGAQYTECFIQTDAPINPGNSGGPLFNSRGEAVGVNVLSAQVDGLGFATSLQLIDLKSILQNTFKKKYLGAEALLENFERTGIEKPSATDIFRLKEATNLDDFDTLKALLALTRQPGDKCAIVYGVELNSPANRAGIENGDLITKFNNQDIYNGMDLRIALRNAPEKSTIEMVRIRNGAAQILTVTVTLSERAMSSAEKPAPIVARFN